MHNQVRIIGGRWRGRKISFPNLPSLRPTPNRVRETLFNWLMPVIQNADCLDMFAGSGSLSFEALSRGAASVELWESDQQTLNVLKDNARHLQAKHFETKLIHFPDHLPKYSQPCFDLIFLDPPFNKGYIELACHWLAHSNCLKPGALIYIEAELSLETLWLAEGWEILKSKKAGDVRFFLVKASPLRCRPGQGRAGAKGHFPALSSWSWKTRIQTPWTGGRG